MELLWAMSSGERSDMEAWDRADVFEFYRGLLIHKQKVEEQLREIDAKKHGRTNPVRGPRRSAA